jgi:hypothetical protein
LFILVASLAQLVDGKMGFMTIRSRRLSRSPLALWPWREKYGGSSDQPGGGN